MLSLSCIPITTLGPGKTRSITSNSSDWRVLTKKENKKREQIKSQNLLFKYTNITFENDFQRTK